MKMLSDKHYQYINLLHQHHNYLYYLNMTIVLTNDKIIRSSKDHKNCCLQWYAQDPAQALETYDEYYTAYYLYTDKRYKYYQGNDWYNPTQEQINTGLYMSGINGITINIKEDMAFGINPVFYALCSDDVNICPDRIRVEFIKDGIDVREIEERAIGEDEEFEETLPEDLENSEEKE